jgi:hypothetical protein
LVVVLLVIPGLTRNLIKAGFILDPGSEAGMTMAEAGITE